MPLALLVEDDPQELSLLTQLVKKEGFEVQTAETLDEAKEAVRGSEPDLLLLDLTLPDGSGMDLLDFLEETSADPEVLLITDEVSVESAVDALRRRVLDYLPKPLDMARLRHILGHVSRNRGLREELRELRRQLRGFGRFGSLVGESQPMQDLYTLIEKVAPTNATVFLFGESGCGKELVAETIHRLSKRRHKPLLPLNCGAVSPNLIESELFGHERGSFTGASRTHQGYFERASGGTLFLDEITEMPPELQVKLLRVLETSTVTRIGGDKPIKVDTRVLAASNRDPDEAVSEGKLRQDLYYRLQVFPVRVPTLRERPEDIRILTSYFLKTFSEQYEVRKGISKKTLDLLEEYPWPGNVRELKNVLNRAFILAEREINVRLLPSSISQREPGESGSSAGELSGGIEISPEETLAEAEKKLIVAALKKYGGDKKKAAKSLGISLRTLYNRLKEYKHEEEPETAETA